jgi:DNA-binding response OmpR family regulator
MANRAASEYLEDLGLLPGEDPTTPYAEDARLWVTVYTELARFAARSLARLQGNERLPSVDGDRGQLETHARHLELRLAFWQRRSWQLGGVEFEAESRRLRHLGREVVLTRREAQLFAFLSAHPGQHFTAERLKAEAWHAPYLSEEQLRSYVARLRARLRELRIPTSIRSEAGRGYALVLDPEA